MGLNIRLQKEEDLPMTLTWTPSPTAIDVGCRRQRLDKAILQSVLYFKSGVFFWFFLVSVKMLLLSQYCGFAVSWYYRNSFNICIIALYLLGFCARYIYHALPHPVDGQINDRHFFYVCAMYALSTRPAAKSACARH
jgi:hypothetical protein